MRKWFRIILIGFILMNSILKLYSQESKTSELSIQLELGYANTLHYNAPVALFNYIEGGDIFSQNAKYNWQYELNLFRKIAKYHDLKLGVGLSKYSFTQKREDWTGLFPNFYDIKKELIEFRFVNFVAGHRYRFGENEKIILTIGNDLIFEKTREDDRAVQNGFAIKSQVGVIANIYDQFFWTFEVFYKTAINNYSNSHAYYPRMWGLEIGINYAIK